MKTKSRKDLKDSERAGRANCLVRRLCSQIQTPLSSSGPSLLIWKNNRHLESAISPFASFFSSIRFRFREVRISKWLFVVGITKIHVPKMRARTQSRQTNLISTPRQTRSDSVKRNWAPCHATSFFFLFFFLHAVGKRAKVCWLRGNRHYLFRPQDSVNGVLSHDCFAHEIIFLSFGLFFTNMKSKDDSIV